MSIQRLIFFVLSALFFIGSSMWIKDEFCPGWMKYQKEYYKEQAVKVEKEYSAASSAKEKELLGKRLASLKRPVYEVKQILLKGDYSWDKGQNGDKVDRCITCHIDEEKLKAKHPNAKEFPFDIYGCAVCHGGIGRALNEEVAHEGIYYHKRQMEQRLVAAEPLFEFWSELATLTPEESDPNQRVEMGDFKKYSITGDKAIYVGSQKCLKCHTTGYDETTGRYSEEGVTCEACHGAGEVFAYFMDIGKALEGQKIAKVGTFGTPYNICGPCHHPRNH